MRVARLYVERDLAPASEVALDDAAAHHILRVLRLRPGAALAVFDGSGREYAATLSSASRHGARIAVGECRTPARESPLAIHLVQAVARGERMDLVMQKATELGVSAITPLLTERSVVKFDSARARKRTEHWRRVVIHACEQSGRVRIPPIEVPLRFDAWLQRPPGAGLQLMLQPGAGRYLDELEQPPAGSVTVAIGPEGGFSARERELLATRGFVAVSLGPRVLRTETAAIALLATLQALWGDARAGAG